MDLKKLNNVIMKNDNGVKNSVIKPLGRSTMKRLSLLACATIVALAGGR